MIGKKGSKIRLVTLAQATEEALCFGWIDSAMRPVDDDHFVLRYTPRRKGSNWSARNVALAERLIEEGRMTEAGLVEIDAADAADGGRRREPDRRLRERHAGRRDAGSGTGRTRTVGAASSMEDGPRRTRTR